jgi:hypothetical protein
MLAESNGVEDPRVRDSKRRPLGIMQIPRWTGKHYGYRETDLKKTTNNIYLWAVATNADAVYLHGTYASAWTKPKYDFWLAVRLLFIVDRKNFANLYSAASASSAEDAVAQTIISWIQTTMTSTQHVGSFRYRDCVRIARHLQEVEKALLLLDGPDHESDNFGAEVISAPDDALNMLEATLATSNAAR